MLRRLILTLAVCLVAVSASAQTRIAGTNSSGNAEPYGALNGTLPVSSNCTGVIVNQTSATTTELVALTAGQSVYICGFIISNTGVATTPATFKLVYGTGTNCATGTTDLTGVFTGSTTAGDIATFAYGGGAGFIVKAPAGNAVCITSTTTQPQRGLLSYQKF